MYRVAKWAPQLRMVFACRKQREGRRDNQSAKQCFFKSYKMKRKYFTIIFIVTIIYINAFAQPAIKAQKDYGGNSDDIFISMYLTTDDGLIAGGLHYTFIQ